MKYLTIPFRFLGALLIIILKTFLLVVFSVCIFIWNLSFKKVYYQDLFDEIFNEFYKSGHYWYSIVYTSFWNYVMDIKEKVYDNDLK